MGRKRKRDVSEEGRDGEGGREGGREGEGGKLLTLGLSSCESCDCTAFPNSSACEISKHIIITS